MTLVIEDGGGTWTALASCGDGPAQVGATGSFTYEGDRVTMREPGEVGEAVFTWSVEDQTLTLGLVAQDERYAPPEALRYIFERAFELDSSSGALTRIPDGTYRAVGTRQDSLRTGWVSDCDLELVDEHIAMVVADNGASWTLLIACGDSPLETGAAGTVEYSDSGEQLTVLEPGYPRGQTFAWSLDDGALTLTIVELGGASEEDVAAGKFLFERTFTMDSPS